MIRPTPHLDHAYEADVTQLTTHLLTTGARAEGMIRDAVRALVDRDAALARSVVAGDRELNRLEIETDDLCVRLLARHAPVGQDLRLVLCALKCVVDLERVGDLAVNIAKRTLGLNAQAGLQPTDEVLQAAQAAVDLTQRAVASLRDRDAALARAVMAEDRALDLLNKEIFRQMIVFAKDHNDQLERALAYTSVSRHLERVGDHAVNVAEMVVFLVEGRSVRHGGAAGASGAP